LKLRALFSLILIGFKFFNGNFFFFKKIFYTGYASHRWAKQVDPKLTNLLILSNWVNPV